MLRTGKAFNASAEIHYKSRRHIRGVQWPCRAWKRTMDGVSNRRCGNSDTKKSKGCGKPFGKSAMVKDDPRKKKNHLPIGRGRAEAVGG